MINQNKIKKYEVSKPVMKKKTVNSQYRPLIEMNATDNETIVNHVVKEKDVNSQQGPLFSLAATDYDINNQNYFDGDSHLKIEDYEELIEENNSMEMDDDNSQVQEENVRVDNADSEDRDEGMEMDNVDIEDREEAMVMDNVDIEYRERDDEEGTQKINKQKSKFECYSSSLLGSVRES